MTTKTTIFYFILFCFFGLQISQLEAQVLEPLVTQKVDTLNKKQWKRSNNLIMLGAGSTLVNGDFNAPKYENFFQLQYKRFVTRNLNINANFKKFDIENFDFDANGFLSGDLNLEWYILPSNRFTPSVFVGAGILTSNDFNDQNYKTQGGIGLEFLITTCIALTVTAEVNYIYDEQTGSQLLQEADNLYYNGLVGVQFYFGRTKKATKQTINKNQATIINTNPIHSN